MTRDQGSDAFPTPRAAGRRGRDRRRHARRAACLPAVDPLESRIALTLTPGFGSWYSELTRATGLTSPTALTVDPATRTAYYASSETRGDLYRIDPATNGSSLLKSSFGTGWGPGSAFAPAQTDLEFVQGSVYTVTVTGDLLQINAATGSTAKLNRLAGVGSQAGLAAVGNKLYLTDGLGSADGLQEYDLSTGGATLRATSLPASASTLEYDPANDRLVFYDPGTTGLYAVNLSTFGVTTLVTSTGLSGGNIAVDPTGRYAYMTNNVATLYRVDLTAPTAAPVAFAISASAYRDLKFGPSSSGFGTSLYVVNAVNELLEFSGFNAAPRLNSGTTLSSLNEDPATNPGTSVATLLARMSSPVTDPDPGAQQGIVVYSVTVDGGTWQYSIDNGSTWTAFEASGPLSSGSGITLAVDSLVRLVPAADFNGSAGFRYRAWDRAPRGENVGTFSTSPGTRTSILLGPTSPFSAETATASLVVNPVNDVPSFTKGANVTVNEDSAAYTQFSWATGASAGPANESGQFLTFLTSNDNAALFSVQPQVSTAGTLTFTPAPDAYGTATVTLQLRDSGGTARGGSDTSAPQTFTITVNPVNDAPSFTPGPDQSVNEDAGPQTVPGWATAINAGPANESGQSVRFELTPYSSAFFSVPPAVSPDGTLTYTPAPNQYGTVYVVVRAVDDGGTAGGGLDRTGYVSFAIDLAPVNDAPSFTKGPDVTVTEDSRSTYFYNWVTNTSAGPNEFDQGVTFVLENDNPDLFTNQPQIWGFYGLLSFDLAPDAYGKATVTVRAVDTGGTARGGRNTSEPQTFTITVLPVNDLPAVTVGPGQVVDEDAGPQTVTGWATGLSAGPANESGQTLAFEVTSNNPGLFTAAPAVSPDGTLTYTPAPDASGVALVTVVARDDGGTANGGIDGSYPRNFMIVVNPVDDAPTLDPIGDVAVDEDAAAVSVPLTGISPGPASESGQVVSVSVTTDNPGLIGTPPVSYTAPGTTGALTFTPAPNASGAATVTVAVTERADRTPVPLASAARVDAAEMPGSLPWDPDHNIASDGAGNFVVVWEGQGGDSIFVRRFSADGTALDAGVRVDDGSQVMKYQSTVVAADDGRYVVAWTAYAAEDVYFNRIHARRYNADGSPDGGEFLVNASVPGHHDSPAIAMTPDGRLLVAWTIYDGGEAWDVYAQRYDAAGAAEGEAFQVSSDTLRYASKPSVAVADDGRAVVAWMSYGAGGDGWDVLARRYDATGVPDGGEFHVNTTTASEQFTPSVAMAPDGRAVIAWASINPEDMMWDVLAQRYDATGAPDGGEFRVNSTVAGDQLSPSVAVGDDGGFVVAWSAYGQNGTVAGAYAQSFTADGAPRGVEFPLSPGNAYQTVPSVTLGAGQSLLALWGEWETDSSLVYRRFDTSDVVTTTTRTFTVTVNPVNDPPDATGDAYTTLEDTPLVVDAAHGVLANDGDVEGDALTVTVGTAPARGTLVLNADGSFTYTPSENANGTDSFTYVVSDGQGGTATGTVTIEVTPDNDAPPVLSLPKPGFVTDEDTPVTVQPGYDDGDPEAVQSLAFAVVTPPAHGTATIDPFTGAVTYTPDPDFNGDDRLEVTVTDDDTAGGPARTTVVEFVVTVLPVNDAPVATGFDVATDEDTPAAVQLVADDGDPEITQVLTYAIVTGPAHGTLALDAATGQAVYTPDADYSGPDSFTYTATDDGTLPKSSSKKAGKKGGGVGEPLTGAPATVNVLVRPVNDAPVVVSVSNDGPREYGDSVTVTVSAGDVDGPTLRYAFDFDGDGVDDVGPQADGQATWQYDAVGTKTVRVRVTDGDGGEATAVTTLVVTPRAVTVTADVRSKVYGEADPDLTYAVTSGTVLAADAFTGVLSRAPGEGVGTYAIGQGTLDLGPNYSLTFAGSTLAVTARGVTVTADAKSKVYGESDPALTYQVTVGTLAAGDAFTGALAREAGEHVGSYAIGQGDLSLGANYSLTFAGSTLAVAARGVTVTADAKSKVYGESDPALTYRVTVGTLAAGDAFTGDLAREAGEGVGSYTIALGTLTLGADYDLSYEGADLTVTARGVTVTADAKGKVYGEADPALTYQVTDGSLAAGDAFTGALAREAGEGVGAYAIGQGTLSLGENYALVFVPADLSVTPRAVTVTADAKGKVYGEGDPALTFAVTAGSPVGSDGFTGGLTRDAGEQVGSYAIRQGSLSLGPNYALAFVPADLTIGRAETSTTLSSSANPALPGQSVTVTAVVAVVSPGSGTPAGSVVFSVGSTVVATVPLSVVAGASQASFTFTAPASGTRTVTATYANSDGHYLDSSASLTQAVYNPNLYVNGGVLYVLGANTSDTALIAPAGPRADGSTGLLVDAVLNRVSLHILFDQPLTGVVIVGYGGNDDFEVDPRLTLPTAVTVGNGNNQIVLGGGDNTVTAGHGNNRVTSGGGSDAVVLGNGNNQLDLGGGDNSLTAGHGNNQVTTGAGADVVVLGNGNNQLDLGGGDNALTAGHGNNTATFGGGDDDVRLGDGNNTVALGEGDNVLVEGKGNNTVTAGHGANLIAAGLGKHTIQVGNGNNILIDGAVALASPGDSLRAVLADWKASPTAAVNTRLKVTYNTSNPGSITAGTGRDWWFVTNPKTKTNRKSTDRLN